MKEKIREYFRELSGLMGVSGSEQSVVKYLKEKLDSLADEVNVDSSGNIIAIKHGKSPGPKLMIAAHSPVELVNINDAVGLLKILIGIVNENGNKDLSFI